MTDMRERIAALPKWPDPHGIYADNDWAAEAMGTALEEVALTAEVLGEHIARLGAWAVSCEAHRLMATAEEIKKAAEDLTLLRDRLTEEAVP